MTEIWAADSEEVVGARVSDAVAEGAGEAVGAALQEMRTRALKKKIKARKVIPGDWLLSTEVDPQIGERQRREATGEGSAACLLGSFNQRCHHVF